jgi:hypothetical protein
VGTDGVDPGATSLSRRARVQKAIIAPDSYGLVLVLIVVTYGLAVSQGDSHVLATIVVFVQIATVWFVLQTAQARRAVRAAALVVLGLAGAVALAGGIAGGEGSELLILLASTILYLVAPIVVMRHLVARSVIDRQAVLGVIVAYLLIGMFFAFVYRVMGVFQPEPFFGSGGDATPSATLFFSFTSLSTTGYGNLVPAGSAGQTVAVAEMLIGQLFLITAVGKVISVWSPIRSS